jgi:O-acetylhomoserine/O-acetylserine sulfhydrylase-like pyridoxal-dependent enzyme
VVLSNGHFAFTTVEFEISNKLSGTSNNGRKLLFELQNSSDVRNVRDIKSITVIPVVFVISRLENEFSHKVGVLEQRRGLLNGLHL